MCFSLKELQGNKVLRGHQAAYNKAAKRREEAEDTGALIMEWKFLRAHGQVSSGQGKKLEVKQQEEIE